MDMKWRIWLVVFIVLLAVLCWALLRPDVPPVIDTPTPKPPTATSTLGQSTAVVTPVKPTETLPVETLVPSTVIPTVITPDDKTPQPPQPTITSTPCPWCYPWPYGCLCHQDVENCKCSEYSGYSNDYKDYDGKYRTYGPPKPDEPDVIYPPHNPNPYPEPPVLPTYNPYP